MTGKQEKRWAVVCDVYVSGASPTKEEAQDHLIATNGICSCKSVHTVEFTDLPYGSRVVGKS